MLEGFSKWSKWKSNKFFGVRWGNAITEQGSRILEKVRADFFHAGPGRDYKIFDLRISESQIARDFGFLQSRRLPGSSSGVAIQPSHHFSNKVPVGRIRSRITTLCSTDNRGCDNGEPRKRLLAVFPQIYRAKSGWISVQRPCSAGCIRRGCGLDSSAIGWHTGIRDSGIREVEGSTTVE